MESTLCRFHETAASSALLPAGDIVEACHDVQSFVILARGTLVESLDVDWDKSACQVKNMKSPPEGVITVSKALCWMQLGSGDARCMQGVHSTS